MSYFHWITGSLLALIWLSRVIDTSLGVRTLTDISTPEWDRNPATPAGSPSVTIIVPARNEESSIQQALSRLLAMDYGNNKVIAIDDRSTDRTGEIMDELVMRSGPPGPPTDFSRLSVLHIRELLPGWMGKAHAMWSAAKQSNSEWLLFTDADVMFRPDCLRRAVAYAEGASAVESCRSKSQRSHRCRSL